MTGFLEVTDYLYKDLVVGCRRSCPIKRLGRNNQVKILANDFADGVTRTLLDRTAQALYLVPFCQKSTACEARVEALDL